MEGSSQSLGPLHSCHPFIPWIGNSMCCPLFCAHTHRIYYINWLYRRNVGKTWVEYLRACVCRLLSVHSCRRKEYVTHIQNKVQVDFDMEMWTAATEGTATSMTTIAATTKTTISATATPTTIATKNTHIDFRASTICKEYLLLIVRREREEESDWIDLHVKKFMRQQPDSEEESYVTKLLRWRLLFLCWKTDRQRDVYCSLYFYLATHPKKRGGRGKL